MGRRGKRRGSAPRRRRGLRLGLWANLLLLVVGGLWYAAQPQTRRDEVNLLLRNYVRRGKGIRLTEVVVDIWGLYYSDQFVAAAAPPGREVVYAGVPVVSGLKHAVRVLRNRAYAVGYCDALQCPVWVAYRLCDVDGRTAELPRPESFEVDSRTVARVRPEDLAGQGYDRGHLAPSFGIGRCFGDEAQAETFLMSNVIPQRHVLNAGPWRQLEMREALNYTGRFGDVWVLAGPVFGPEPWELPCGMRVPEACYRVVLDESEGRVRVLAFRLPQEVDPEVDVRGFLTSVDAIEAATGLDLFPDLAAEAQARLEAGAAARVW